VRSAHATRFQAPNRKAEEKLSLWGKMPLIWYMSGQRPHWLASARRRDEGAAKTSLNTILAARLEMPLIHYAVTQLIDRHGMAKEGGEHFGIEARTEVDTLESEQSTSWRKSGREWSRVDSQPRLVSLVPGMEHIAHTR
jgi:hypothetical protein